jgi:hypothetical protein
MFAPNSLTGAESVPPTRGQARWETQAFLSHANAKQSEAIACFEVKEDTPWSVLCLETIQNRKKVARRFFFLARGITSPVHPRQLGQGMTHLFFRVV